MSSAIAKRIVVLQQPDGDVVAEYAQLGKVVGQFRQIPSGEIYFTYCSDGRRLYVNKSLSAFCEAAGVFNRCCQAHVDDEDTDDEATWSSVVAQLRRGFEQIEQLGDPETSLWSATIHDAECGLLTLY